MINRALKLAREFHRLKQYELAKQLSISTSYLSEIESGDKPPSLQLLQTYARVFDVPASTFLLFDEQVIGSQDQKRKLRADRLLKFFEWVSGDPDDDEQDRGVRRTRASKVSKTGTTEKAI